ncbi:23S rRNA (uracil(1939)-C(5))-methyltransferase RlmD [Oceanivirga miroungae]|uniref:(Uracil-5)-methyltransferase n=1 Tax=Oceanivirga miroungae TaxID=1130046 RepID=A0A6I8MDR2_9FUSO|nr:23S rRNA (uracil(1939)-C(5))-methyltransferase RlmD [Oceanivirga miroungae]VWL85583.1 (uracil-5)-methyltransferase [Oceanivirga miroungae]
MKKNDVIRVTISGTDIRGKSYSIVDDKKIYVNINASKGQVVEGLLSKLRKNKLELKNCVIVDYNNKLNSMYDNILDKQLSGANYQYYDYDTQLEIKSGHIKKLIDDVCNYEYIFEKAIKNSRPIRYRNKMEFSFGNETKDGEMLLGLHKKNSMYDIVDVSDNNLMGEEFNRIYKFSNEYFKSVEKKLNISFYHKMTKLGYFRYLVLRKSRYSKEVLINLVTTSYIDKELEEKILNDYVKKLLELDLGNYHISGILHSTSDKLADAVSADYERLLYGKKDIVEKIFDLKFNISPYSFFQVNPYTVESLYKKAIDYLDEVKLENEKEKVVYDLFSGTGTIAQIVSRKFKKVYAVEIVEEAVQKSKENAKLNNIDNIEFLVGDVFKVLDEVSEKPNIIILDPPRMGVLTKTIEKLVKYDVDNFVYISCNPVTLANDLKDFNKYGYKLIKITPVDMFSYTNHMETVALIQKAK